MVRLLQTVSFVDYPDILDAVYDHFAQLIKEDPDEQKSYDANRLNTFTYFFTYSS